MADHDAFATAAHLHVLLRRKTGRVTDTEWMATNAEYATAMVAFARSQAATEGHAELLPWADRLETLIPHMGVPVRRPLVDVAAERLRKNPGTALRSSDFIDSTPPSGFRESGTSGYASNAPGTEREASENRYVGRLR